MFDKWIEQLKPQAILLGRRAEEYAETTVSHLSVIAENSTPATDETSRTYRRNVVAANAVAMELFQVPVGQTWHLEAVTAVAVAGNAIFTLRNGPGGAPLFADNGSSPGTVGGSGVIFQSGHVVTIDNGANQIELGLQIRIEIKQPKRKVHTKAAGTFERRPPEAVDQSTERHVVGNVSPVPNYHGGENGRS